ncbi:hypothetical protein D3C80_833240 [compost metagenome]
MIAPVPVPLRIRVWVPVLSVYVTSVPGVPCTSIVMTSFSQIVVLVVVKVAVGKPPTVTTAASVKVSVHVKPSIVSEAPTRV